MKQDTTLLDRLLALAAEVERTLTHRVASDEIRDACAIARGYLDLVRLYGEPINVDDLERVFARIADAIADAKFQRRFLTQLRTIAAWDRITPTEFESLTPPGQAVSYGARPRTDSAA